MQVMKKNIPNMSFCWQSSDGSEKNSDHKDYTQVFRGAKKSEEVKFCALVCKAIRQGQILPSHVLGAW